MPKEHKSSEIDLFELFLKGIIVIRSNFWLILLFFVLGTLLGLSYYYSSTKIYQSRMMVSSGILTRSYSKGLIENINRYKRESNLEALQKMLGISEPAVRSIAYLKIESLSQLDDLKESDRFVISADLLNPEYFPEVQKGIIHYLENNDYVKVRVKQNEKYLKEVLVKIDTEIKDMEEFKRNIVNGTFFQNVKGNISFDPTTVNSKILELTKEKINLQNTLALVSSVQIIEPFSKFEQPSRPRLLVSLFSGSFVGLISVICFIAFKSIRKLLRMAADSKQDRL